MLCATPLGASLESGDTFGPYIPITLYIKFRNVGGAGMQEM